MLSKQDYKEIFAEFDLSALISRSKYKRANYGAILEPKYSKLLNYFQDSKDQDTNN